jgi:acetyltransferase
LQTGVWHTWADYLANIDYQRRMAIVTLGPSVADPELIAVARYESMAHEDVAEIALVVQDSWQGRGLGAFLLREILRVGERNGIQHFRGNVLAQNGRMLRLLHRWTDIRDQRREGSVVTLDFTCKRGGA